MAMIYDNFVSSFIKYNRSKLQMTQEQLADKAGVGLRFIRELERGKETLRMDKVNQVLQLFGYALFPVPGRQRDPYGILLNHINKNVQITLKDKAVVAGVIVEEMREGTEIKAWKFVPNNNAVQYRKTGDPKLLTTIRHEDIDSIENI